MFQENINLENCIVQLISYEKNIYIFSCQFQKWNYSK